MVRLHRWQNNVAKTCQEQVAACEAAVDADVSKKCSSSKGQRCENAKAYSRNKYAFSLVQKKSKTCLCSQTAAWA